MVIKRSLLNELYLKDVINSISFVIFDHEKSILLYLK